MKKTHEKPFVWQGLMKKFSFDNVKDLLNYWKEILRHLIVFDNLLYLVIGIVACLISVLVVKDFWGFYYAAPFSIIFLFLMIKRRDYAWMGKLGWLLIAFTIVAMFTPIYGSGIGWYSLGFLTGIVVFLIAFGVVGWCFMTADLGDYNLGIWLSSIIIALVLFFIQAGLLSAEENRLLAEKEKMFDKQLVDAPWQKPQKHIIETRCGTTYHVLIIRQDTLDLSVCDYPEIKYMDEDSQIRYVLDSDKKIQRLEIR